MTIFRSKRLRLWGDDTGTVTLEASMIFPWVFLMTLIVLLFSLFISQRALLYYGVSVTAERTAFNWSNSAKETLTGAYPEGRYDGLYWRLADDGLVLGLFGLGGESGATQVDVIPGMEGTTGASPADKLRRGAFESASKRLLGAGKLSYLNIGIKREIEARVEIGWLPAPLAWLRGDERAGAKSSALIVEPAEFLRSFNLIRYYASKMKEAPGGETEYRDKAGDVLKKRG
ncbi:hypothetical protein D7Z26_10465 [Cohnella endophytica]|uniref:Pilus assembly protein n=1 Tax=Cohnella endophytica TaxID=2419778 RepID=A0A494XVE4_9BACL|nr:hypothetical protein [Cohnella endophytica]RKP53815.1 hypothetical protein D7Z26_10465 [Cohnella endophytica]